MRTKSRILGLIIVAGFMLITTGCASRVVYVRQAPPVRKVEVRPARPFANAVWIDGHWRWNDRAYLWVPGHWVKVKKGKSWVAGHWVRTRRGFRWVPGHWR